MEKYQFSPEKQSILEGMPQPLAVYQFLDGQVVTLALSDGFCKLFGYSDRDQAYYDMDHDMYKYDHPDDIERITEAAYQFATIGGGYDVIYRTMSRTGPGYRVIHAIASHIYTETGVRLAYVWYTDEGIYTEDPDAPKSDFTRSLFSALHEESLLKASQYDSLTGLPRMSGFFRLAEEGKLRTQKEDSYAVLLYINLSGMKSFNQKYGYAEGDRYLRLFADTLAGIFGMDYCSRLGQDHFGAYSEESLVEERLSRLFKECELLNGGVTLPVHAGIYSSRVGDVPVASACDRAKLACDSLRGTYTSKYKYYTPALGARLEKKQYILEHLDKALANQWIQVYYQPIVRAINGRVCDEEALARWNDPEKGMLSPADFIPFLEEANLIYKLDLYMVEQVLDKIKLQMQKKMHIVPHSVNLSRSDFQSCDIVEEIRKRVDDAGIRRDLITIEVTESILEKDFDFMKEQITRFQTLGFPVWMDDFGSGYSSLDVLQSIKFNLLKFDSSFMKKLDEGTSGKIILTELMKMATSLGIDTVCEGVETKDQVRFLQEIGCSKLQGYYFCRPIPLEGILERYQKGIQIGYENPEESSYFETMGRINLYDVSVIASEGGNDFQNYFNTLPMGIIEVKDDTTRFVRSNQSYRDFIKRFFKVDLSYEGFEFFQYSASFMYNVVRSCCEQGLRAFYDEKMPDGSIIHSFARRIGINPVTGNIAVAVAVLSISEPDEGTTYADIARKLASDYYNIYYVDMDTDHYIEYSSRKGRDEQAIERHGEDFFTASIQESITRVYQEDQANFLSVFTKENIIQKLDEQGVFSLTYRLVDSGIPVYANMKIKRMMPGENRIIIGISIIDSQMKQQALFSRLQKERKTLARIMTLNDDHLSLYIINPETDHFIEYTMSDEEASPGLSISGDDFFDQFISDGEKTVWSEDLPSFYASVTKDRIMDEIQNNGVFKLQYRLDMDGEPKPVSLKIAPFTEDGELRLFAGVRAWRNRNQRRT